MFTIKFDGIVGEPPKLVKNKDGVFTAEAKCRFIFNDENRGETWQESFPCTAKLISTDTNENARITVDLSTLMDKTTLIMPDGMKLPKWVCYTGTSNFAHKPQEGDGVTIQVSSLRFVEKVEVQQRGIKTIVFNNPVPTEPPSANTGTQTSSSPPPSSIPQKSTNPPPAVTPAGIPQPIQPPLTASQLRMGELATQSANSWKEEQRHLLNQQDGERKKCCPPCTLL